MALLRVMLVLSALLMSVENFTITTHLEGTRQQKPAAEDIASQKSQQPQAILVNRNNSNHKSIIVEFANRNSKENASTTQGTEHEKYIINYISTEPKNSKSKEIEKYQTLLTDLSDILYLEEAGNYEQTDVNPKLNKEENTGKVYIDHNSWSLTPKEASSITEALPKYFHDVVKYVPPFSEINSRMKLKEDPTSIVEKQENSKLFFIPEKINEPLISAGPSLHPRPKYIGEFDIPSFE